MYICEGHFLAPYIVVIKDGKPATHIRAVDTDLNVAQRLVGYTADKEPLTDLIKIDKILIIEENVPDVLKDMIPDGFEYVKANNELIQSKEG